MKPPVVDIDTEQFWKDPYPDLAHMRAKAPVCFVPQLNAVLLTKRDDIFTCEKNTAVFSSEQPGGLMTVLMGENMMRKDGPAHMTERRQANASWSAATVKKTWKTQFESDVAQLLDQLESRTHCDLLRDFAMPASGNALRRVTGLVNMTPSQLDASSQAMIDGIANYAGDARIEARCHEGTALIDASIDERLPQIHAAPDSSMLSVLTSAGQPIASVRANIKLAISGGQNEPRDAIAGAVWALLKHPDQLASVMAGKQSWLAAFEEYARWISPIGMSPRRIAQSFTWQNATLEPDQRAFLMFSSANRDETVFENAAHFDISRSHNKSLTFGAGPHFCAGAWVSRCLIADVALPMLFARFPKLSLNGDVPFGGWAFRGPLEMPVRLR